MYDVDLSNAEWHRSSLSDGTESCVEIATVPGSKEGSEYVIALRNSDDPDGPALIFTPAEWDAFVAGVLAGEFDLEDADEAGA
jgi:hypothetical protein